jgi:hypothetical protein
MMPGASTGARTSHHRARTTSLVQSRKGKREEKKRSGSSISAQHQAHDGGFAVGTVAAEPTVTAANFTGKARQKFWAKKALPAVNNAPDEPATRSLAKGETLRTECDMQWWGRVRPGLDLEGGTFSANLQVDDCNPASALAHVTLHIVILVSIVTDEEK